MNSRLHGSEGAGTQQCFPATRLIVGARNASQILTLVERTTRFVMLQKTPYDRRAERVSLLLAECVQRLPAMLWRSITHDQGVEMADHARFTIKTNIPVFFCDPYSPWHRGSNENTNGLLRQYFPKSTDLSVHSQARVVCHHGGSPDMFE